MALLDLPVELREHIFNEVLDTYRGDAPVNPAATVDDRKAIGHSHIFVKKMQNPALAVLLANRQLHEEMKGVIGRKSSQRASYALDIMYVKNSGFWSTFLSAPTLTTDLDTVHVTFRLFNQPDNIPKEMDYRDMWRGGDGGPPAGVWVFYHMITNFFNQRIGPWPRRVDAEAEKITVQRLILDVVTPLEPDILPLAEYRRRPGRDYMSAGWRKGEAPPAPSRVFANFMSRQIGFLLCMSSDRMSYGQLLHERFGSIEVRIDGESFHSWDVSEIFAQLPLQTDTLHRWTAERKMDYRKWKLEVAEKRRRAGFKVVEEDETRRWWE